MIITKSMFDKKVPVDMFPTRLDSAMNLYAYIDKKGLLLYNINPTTWNCLYPFFELNHKFTIDDYEFQNKDITFKELIEEYQAQYKKIYEQANGYDKKTRMEVLLQEYKKTFHIKQVKIKGELEGVYELKYSKSKNVWTLYYFENYVVSEIDSIENLLNQKIYPQEFIMLNSSLRSINGIDIVENLLYLLENQDNIKIIEENKLTC